MVDILNEKREFIDGDINILTRQLSNGQTIELRQRGDTVLQTKTINQDGSYEIVNAANVKLEELTTDGVLRKYNPQSRKLLQEVLPDGTEKTYFETGQLERIHYLNGTHLSYYRNGNLAVREDKNNIIAYDENGHTQYKFENGRLEVNPDFFSYYRLGIKTKDNSIHWQEKAILNPKKKTFVCLGGDQTKEARNANGNINAFAKVLGLTDEQKDNMQLVSCYRPSDPIRYLSLRAGGIEQRIAADYKREILSKFMPFMAKIENGKPVRYSGKELAENFRNIFIQAHCAGANDLPHIVSVFNETMNKLGYTLQERKNAMRQVICVTNNSQREMTDNLDFTCIHRYSVKDGQFEPEYEEKYSKGYPVFIKDNSAFGALDGTKAGFVKIKDNEMLMAFDKILLEGSEHNDGFWTTNEKKLTLIGKYQANLMKKIGQFWYNNTQDVPTVINLLKKCTDNTVLKPFVEKSLAFGKNLTVSYHNALENHHILKAAWNRFKNPNIEPEKTGVYKLLSTSGRVV